MELQKLEVTFLAELSRKKLIGFLWKQLKLKFFLYFCFDSFHSFKARSEKHEVLANWFVSEMFWNEYCSKIRVPTSAFQVKFIDIKSNDAQFW